MRKGLYEDTLQLFRRHGIALPGSKIPKSYWKLYAQQLKKTKEDSNGYIVYEKFFYDGGVHPSNNADFQCAFAAEILSKITPSKILDVGSYRLFILGLLAHHKVTTIDLRERQPINNNETIITCDAKKLNLPDNEFDTVTSLCALAHFGLGRYGDELDLNADKKAFAEMVRVLKPGGYLIFSANFTSLKRAIAFNAHRIYDYDTIRGYCTNSGLSCIEERFYSNRLHQFCRIDEITKEPNTWDIYLSCWKKKA